MALTAMAVRTVAGIFNRTSSAPVSLGWSPGSSVYSGAGYETYARAFLSNPIVYAAMDRLATAVGEPQIIGRRLRRASPAIRALNLNESRPTGPLGPILRQAGVYREARALGLSNKAGAMRLDEFAIANKYLEEVPPTNPLVYVLNHPNPLMSRGQMQGTLMMDACLAGEWFLYKGRDEGYGNVRELWRMRPDRVEIVPNADGATVKEYKYGSGRDQVVYPANDVIHWRSASPLNDWRGVSPMSAAMGYVSVAAYMQRFLRGWYESGGVGIGSVLSTSSTMTPEAKTESRERFRRLGSSGVPELLIIDNSDVKYQQLSLDRGLRDALPKEISAEIQAAISMVFGIPGSILGTLIGYESSSYANKRQDWQTLWDIKLTPMLGAFDDALSMALCPEFPNVDEVVFDLSDIRALREDEDALHERARKNKEAGLLGAREARVAIGLSPDPDPEELFYVPANGQWVPWERLGEAPEPATTVNVEPPSMGNAIRQGVAASRGRPALLADPEARAVFERCEAWRRDNPFATLAQVAGRLGISERTYRRYRSEFGA